MVKGYILTESHVILWDNVSKLLPNASFVRLRSEMCRNEWSQFAAAAD